MTEATVISPPEGFGPAEYATLAGVAQVAGSKILDCSRLLNVPMDLCSVATANWAAPAGSVPRLAVVVQIDAWALVKMFAPKAIAQVAAHGTELRLFYKRQHTAGHVEAWLLRGTEPANELDATLTDLETVWQGSPMLGNVLDAVFELVRAEPTRARTQYLTRLAGVAQKFGDLQRAVNILRAT